MGGDVPFDSFPTLISTIECGRIIICIGKDWVSRAVHLETRISHISGGTTYHPIEKRVEWHIGVVMGVVESKYNVDFFSMRVVDPEVRRGDTIVGQSQAYALRLDDVFSFFVGGPKRR